MKPQHHFVFAVLSVYALITLFQVQPPLDLPLTLALAGITGMLPDFEHREVILKIVAIAIAALAYPPLSTWWEQMMGWGFLAVLAPAAISLGLGWAFYKVRPFWREATQEIKEKGDAATTNLGSRAPFAILFFLIISFLSSVELGFVLFIAYASHIVLDMVRYGTSFGRTVLARIQDLT